MPPQQLSLLFHLDEDRPNFESLGKENGNRFWYARDFMKMLGYEDFSAFMKAINKAMATCTALNILVMDNFSEVSRVIKGETVVDYKLSRFACYLVAINGDVRKPEVAAAQAYFITMAEAFRHYIESNEQVERVQTREKISDQEKSLSSAAHAAGVEQYHFFRNAGYRGMYNMNLAELKLLKRVASDRSVLDFMGSEELAANLFRITQTEAKIRNEQIRGQTMLEITAESVGKAVRKTMQELSGTSPETLPPASDIKLVKKNLKQVGKEFDKIDGRTKKQLPPPEKE